MARKGSRIGVWAVLILIFIGLIGFGATSISGTRRSLGTVGDKELSISAYTSALTQQLRAFEAQTGQTLSFADARTFGLDQAVLGQVVSARALDNEATGLGLSAGDARVRDAVLQVQAFQGLDGSFDRAAYRDTLQRNNLSEAEFEASLRDDFARSLLQGAVTTGVPAPDAYAAALVGYVLEARSFTWATLTPDALAEPLPEPTEEQLQAQYEAAPEAYTAPEVRDITYAWVTPAMIEDGVEIDEASVRELYDQRIDEFVQAERRLVERLVYPDEATAEAARARVESGEASFEDLVAARGLQLSDADLGDVAQDQLGAAGEAVFGATPGETVGPFETSLGPALFRVNAVLAATEVPFEEAAPDLRTELATARARRVIDDMEGQITDLLAGGATLEDLAERTEMQLDTVAWTEGQTGGIADYDSFREAAAAAAPGAYPELQELSDGGVFALRLDTVTEPQLRPFDEVRDQVIADWRTAATRDALLAQAAADAEAIAGGATFEERGLEPRPAEGLTRRDFLEGTPPEFLAAVFAMAEGTSQAVPAGNGAIVVRLDTVAAPDPEDPAVVAERAALAERAQNAIAQDLFAEYSRAVQEATEVRIDEQAVAAVNSQFR